MMEKQNYVITIGRKIGSQGVYLGQKISEYFDFQYVDREILVRSAEKLNVSEDKLEIIDEKSYSIWGSFLQSSIYDSPYIPTDYFLPTGRQLFEAQTQIIKKAVQESPCVVVGRCGSYIFANHPKHVSIFLHGSPEYRTANVAELFGISMQEARKELEKTDKERARYFNTYTGNHWSDASQYNISIDVEKLGVEKAGDVIINYIITRFPELKK